MTFPTSTAAAVPGLAASTLATPTEAVQRRRIAQTAQDFETSFLSVMIGQMFTDLDTDGPFSGGAGETAFRSFLSDAMARQITRSGGVGLSGAVQAEMLKLQGLS
jgi:Rod binding domain-containing protein